ncbi:hypothetical protein SLEP1_g43385 [Rubroshorea leprosula]|uniref:Uncharacterized protein n=1 Tax=Rubroshorea leprosula TaxID=152421 RepID=A0AAV5LDC7_9ROSI|nr:hypothetical protein SLEP1_g43385 [Rubroshorea leprosula]
MSIEVAVLNFLKILNSPDPEISHLLLFSIRVACCIIIVPSYHWHGLVILFLYTYMFGGSVICLEANKL